MHMYVQASTHDQFHSQVDNNYYCTHKGNSKLLINTKHESVEVHLYVFCCKVAAIVVVVYVVITANADSLTHNAYFMQE